MTLLETLASISCKFRRGFGPEKSLHMPPAQDTLELFHSIAEPESARVRKYVVDHELTGVVRFRNIAYDEVLAHLRLRQGSTTPALWDGSQLHTGAEAIIARLERVEDSV